MRTYHSFSSEETKKFGDRIAKQVLGFRLKVLGMNKKSLTPRRARDKRALIFALMGDLGTGKTTFAQGFLKGLGVRGRVNSPTFVLMKRFAIRDKRFANVYHIDAYRLEKPKELLDLGLREILEDSRNIVLIEWAEKLKRYLPKGTVWVKFSHKKTEKEREICVI